MPAITEIYARCIHDLHLTPPLQTPLSLLRRGGEVFERDLVLILVAEMLILVVESQTLVSEVLILVAESQTLVGEVLILVG